VAATVLATNALNLVDGADGLAAGTALLGALGEAVLLRGLGPAGPATASQAPAEQAPAEPTPDEPALDEITRSALDLATGLAGATAGFLWWNRPPARLHLGDGGAYLLGTTLALLASEAATGPGGTGKPGPGGAEIGWATALLPLAYPLAELGFAVIRRLRAGVAPWVGDRAHLYDRLATRRWPTPLPVAACLALEAGAVLLAVDGARRGGQTRAWCRAGLAASGLLLAGLLGGALRLGA
jgi:UDP-GlcNAc:undecaprenyl-phosphate GlcNAc-1-phosphate transferase